MDILTLKGLKYNARHGYYEQERIEGNPFEVDVIFYADLKKAADTDDLSKTIDYQEIEQIVNSVMQGPSVKLIETLAHRIGKKILNEYAGLYKLEIKVRKLSPPLSTDTEYSEVQMAWNR